MNSQEHLETPAAPPSAAALSLDREQMTLAVRVQDIIDEKDERGQYVYENLDVRDFIIACIFELGLPLTRELELLMHRFLSTEIEVTAAAPTADQVTDAVRKYFVEFPLNEKLNKAFLELGRDTLFASREGFRNDAARRNAMSAATGLRAAARAPMAALAPRPAPMNGKVRRGLS